ncbi:MAG: hypothetical protein R2838_00970 [Caldilineaceae bacterium]
MTTLGADWRGLAVADGSFAERPHCPSAAAILRGTGDVAPTLAWADVLLDVVASELTVRDPVSLTPDMLRRCCA